MFPMLLVPALQAPTPAPKPFTPLEFLVGSWEGEGGGDPGKGTGSFTFGFELANTVLVRRNRADYPATNERPAFSHEDLTVVFSEGGKLRAEYFDNEGHVIRYGITGPDDKGSIQFLSDFSASSPRFRLTYTPTGKDRLSLRFDIAPPGSADGFKTYIEATAKRKK